MRRALLAFVTAALAASAGCLGGAGPADTPDSPSAPDATTDTPTPTPTVTTTETPTTTAVPTTETTAQTMYRTTMEYPYGTQFVSVDRIDNESVVPPLSSSEVVRFENLSTENQTVFERLVAEGEITFRPNDDKSNPFPFSDKSRPKYVRHDGTWY